MRSSNSSGERFVDSRSSELDRHRLVRRVAHPLTELDGDILPARILQRDVRIMSTGAWPISQAPWLRAQPPVDYPSASRFDPRRLLKRKASLLSLELDSMYLVRITQEIAKSRPTPRIRHQQLAAVATVEGQLDFILAFVRNPGPFSLTGVRDDLARKVE